MPQLFDFLKGVTEKKQSFDFTNPEVKKSYQPYMINRFISMSEVFLPFVNAINRFQNIPKSAHYQYYYSFMPERRIYFKYIKRKKDVDKKVRECIKEYFEVGDRDCDSYLELLSEKQIERIINKFKHGKTR